MSLYISSDTNIWSDFRAIDRLDLPFRLSHRFHIAKIVFESEMIEPECFDERILTCGLHLVSVNGNELEQAQI